MLKAKFVAIMIAKFAVIIISVLLVGSYGFSFDSFSSDLTSEKTLTVEEIIASNQMLLSLGYTPQKMKNVASEYSSEPFMVMGFTEEEILGLVGEYKDRYSNVGRNNALACSTDHQQDDIANRWCHASITKIIRESLISRGVTSRLAAVIASTFFIPKEYFIDKNASMSDLVFTIEEKVGKYRDTAIELTIFADGGVFLAIRKKL